MIILCKKFRNDRFLTEELFGEKMNYQFYNKLKEIFTTKNLNSRKQLLIPIVQIHKHFIQIGHLHSQNFLSDQQLDLILQNSQIKCSKQQKYIEKMIEHMAKLGHLQVKLSSILS